MPFPSQDVLSRAITTLNDGGSIRWTLAEILGWINDAVREIALYKPTATAQTTIFSLASGTKQTIPSGYQTLVKVVRNVASGRAITPITADVLNVQIPNWHSASVLPFSADVIHVVDDETDPSVFYVVPGNTGAGEIEVVASATPDPLPVPANPLLITSYSGQVPLNVIYQNAVLDYVLYRAFGKDINLATAGQRSAAHYQQFARAIGLKMQAEQANNVNASAQTRYSPQ